MATTGAAVAAQLMTSWSTRIRLVDAQVSAGHIKADAMNSQFNAILLDISGSSGLDLDGAQSLIHGFNSGPWTADQKKAFSTAVTDRISKPQPTTRQRCNQACDAIDHYFNKADWAVFMNQNLSMHPRVEQCAQRCYLIGIACPNTSILKKLSLLLCASNNEHDADALRKKEVAKDVQKTIKTYEKHYGRVPFAHLPTFPANPLNLPKERLDYAYTDGYPIAPVVIIKPFAEVSMGYRGTHSSLAQRTMALTGGGSSRSRSPAQPSAPEAPSSTSDLAMVLRSLGFKPRSPEKGAETPIQMLNPNRASLSRSGTLTVHRPSDSQQSAPTSSPREGSSIEESPPVEDLPDSRADDAPCEGGHEPSPLCDAEAPLPGPPVAAVAAAPPTGVPAGPERASDMVNRTRGWALHRI